ncbi:PucR family transcriptional regulator [Nocardia sp. NPDC059246]|uniref:PucR family transcriptional regulator n=1 Tax=unclassified Nocardia TaxID=2637762 RepID=UPI0036CCA172
MVRPRDELERWLQDFVAAELQPATVVIQVKRFATFILDRCPELASDPHLRQLVYTTAQAHWTRFLGNLTNAPHETQLIQPAAELAAEIARRRIPLASMYTVYRLALESTWEYITEVLNTIPDDVERLEFLVFFWGRASEWLNGSVGPSVEVYEAERDRLQQGAKARQLDLILNVLGGKSMTAAQLSRGLGGYPISRANTALILCTEVRDSVAILETAALRLGGEVGARQPLTVSVGDNELWCWFGTNSQPDVDAFSRLDAWLGEHQISVGAGAPGLGVHGFIQSHQEAKAAQAHRLRTGHRLGVTLYQDVELLILLNKDEDAAVTFVRRTLGGLAEETVAAERLRETALAFLSRGNVDDTAAALSIHRNTVRYRLAKVEEIIGNPVSRKPVELALALQYFDTFIRTPDAG